ncbi:MAG: histidine kinase N-terminal 7TM domain-containing protein [Phototrophicaceae bacterium]
MFQYSPYILLLAVTLFLSLWLAQAIWSRRPGAGVIPFVVLAIGLVIWVAGDMLQLLVTSLDIKIFSLHISYLGITLAPTAWFAFTLEYIGKERWVNKKLILALAIEPILVQLLLLTNPIHELLLMDVGLMQMDGLVLIDYSWNTLFWVHAIYIYILLATSAVLLIRAMIRSPHLYRGQLTWLCVSVFSPWISNFIYIFGYSPLPKYIDVTVFTFNVTVIATAWGLYRFRLMDIVPIARDVIVENMEDGILVLDTHNRVVDANKSVLKLLNKPVAEVIGKKTSEIFEAQGEIASQFSDTEQIDTEVALAVDGVDRVFRLKISSIYSPEQIITGRVILIHDITSLKEANRALKEANETVLETTRLKSQFLATMSHELRTPLNAIMGYTELQLTGMVGELSDIQYQYGERILSNSHHLLGLINDILDLSKIEAGRMTLNKEVIELDPWINEIVEQNIVLADDKGLKFITEIDPNLPKVFIGDSMRLRQIITNLVSNAIKFTKEGQVTLSLNRTSEQTWSIVVQDTGIGIPPHKLETIFDEFHQVDNSATREYEGTGLGLAIVRKLSMTMAGNVKAESILNVGSSFTVLLPIEAHNIEDTAETNLEGVL